MLVEREWFAEKVLPGFIDPENLIAFRVEDTFRHQVVNGSPGLKGGIQLKQRLGPERAFVQRFIDHSRNAFIRDLDETARVPGIVVHKTVAEIKNVHSILPGSEYHSFLTDTKFGHYD
ncbi:MAG: hypothetical protein BWX80_02764 [Candidatus Hydrogenedentes bacterium ADurb.Bin101]|nr:MAG: hypothetical protein BWX80_02764 [Candidatus Hydrogenedentes bacterium ADurb.Bin101]